MTTTLTLTLASDGIPGEVLDGLEDLLHAYYAKQDHPAYRTWGRIWSVEINTEVAARAEAAE
jgi:hypothetical protein